MQQEKNDKQPSTQPLQNGNETPKQQEQDEAREWNKMAIMLRALKKMRE